MISIYKIKIFTGNGEDMEDKVNDFIKDKDVIEIVQSESVYDGFKNLTITIWHYEDEV